VWVAIGEMSGQARTFGDDEALLHSAFSAVVEASEGSAALELHERAVALGQRSRNGDGSAADHLAQLVADLDLSETEMLIRLLTRWFQLLNLAEDNERVRRLRRREEREAPAPRRGGLRDAVQRLAAAGTTATELAEMLAHAEVRLVMTAHPTEARRRTTIGKLARVFGILRELDLHRLLPEEKANAWRRLAATVQELWGSDEIRAVSPTVLDEVHAGLVYFTSTLVDVIPAFYRELEAAVAESFPGEAVEVPSLLSFGSWMGGDRDGNPHVTPEVTEEALGQMRSTCLRFLEGRVTELAGRVSLSSRLAGEPPELAPRMADAAERFPELAVEIGRRNPEEPYRRFFSFVRARVRATRRGDPGGYAGPDELLADLRTAEATLRRDHGGYIASGDLRDVIRQVEVFGFHFGRLDVREHADRHRAALAEIFATLDVRDGYEALPDAERTELLARAIAERRPLIPTDLSGFSEPTRATVEIFRSLQRLLDGEHAGAVETFIVSGSTGPPDVLEALLLMKESGLARAGGDGARLRIAPLFEAGQTLRDAPATMRALLEQPAYRAALRAVGDQQEVMIGYSDSNKDVGYVASGWATYGAQVAISDVLREHGVSWTFFHGRGGALGRGGGRANVAILSQPPGTVAGRLKMTEQGEVLSAKYSLGDIAHRELELTASAVLVSTLAEPATDRLELYHHVMGGMAERSAEVYRELVYGDREFAEFFHTATPVDEVSRLRLGSRPARRRESRAIEDFRAIPWVFSWTQARIVLPAWYGLGTALEAAAEEHGIELLREMYADWRFFSALLSNAEMACAKADLAIGRRYAELCPDREARERIWSRIEAEFELTERGLLAITGGERLLDSEPTLQASIDRRNPYVDPLSFVQVELLRRARAGERDEALPRAAFLVINGIASGLRNTG
jgi:phosphoenolpyruvate carboxylase